MWDDLFQFLNKPIILTLAGLLGGGVVSNVLAYKWQKRKALYDLKLNAYKETVTLYHSLLKYLHNFEPEKEGEWRDKQGSFKAINRLNKVLFKDKEIFEGWEDVVNNIAYLIAKLYSKRQNNTINKSVEKSVEVNQHQKTIDDLEEKVFNKYSETIERMARELKM